MESYPEQCFSPNPSFRHNAQCCRGPIDEAILKKKNEIKNENEKKRFLNCAINLI